jgi:transcriptional antiterminator RfaH
VNGTYGVTGLVSFGDRPAPTPRGLVERLRELTAESGELSFDDELQPGAQVRVVGGPMDRFVGVFQERDAGSRVRILISILSREVSVSVPRSQVMAIV